MVYVALGMEPGASCMASYQLSHVADPPFTSQASIIKPILASLYMYVLVEYVFVCAHMLTRAEV